ncbi:phage Gp37/Gp68 family protein [Reyranella sp.]|uniref:phage Gp37/Gp68 family protein n=1 Tax=Reyranella sp. TaxID=1929291 RepID=UPI003C7D5092
MGNTNIEWANKVWNPVAGCSIVSPGCTNCYAMKMAHRIEGMNAALGRRNHYAGLTKKTKAGAVWTGKVATAPDSIFLAPLRWKKPATVFVNSMADLFHDDVADETIDRAFAVMALCPHLTFMVLTKRAKRMREYFADAGATRRVIHQAFMIDQPDGAWLSADHEIAGDPILPLRNAWLGVSTEDQAAADERIPHLLATPAAVRFLSGEPLLGLLDLLKWFDPTGACCGGEPEFRCNNCPADADWRYSGQCTAESLNEPRIDWVIAGGESGTRARPAHPDWFRSLRDQCAAAGVPFFFKQWGEWGPDWDGAATCAGCDSRKFDAVTKNGECSQCGEVDWLPVKNPLESLARVGKKAAGAELDGRLHREFPA